MPDLSDSAPPSRQNPLIWIALAVAVLIIFVFVNGDRGEPVVIEQTDEPGETAGTIDRSLLIPPGMRARQYIQQLREAGQPYPLDEVYAKADKYLREGSLADAHLLLFFGAREDHLPAIMRLGEMADPTHFRAEDSLLDHADVIQAYKWYRKAAALGHDEAVARVSGLQQWAQAAAEAGDAQARQLLLNFQ